MSRHKVPLNDSVEIIWNEDGRYGTGYTLGETIFNGEQAKNTILDAVAGTGIAAVVVSWSSPNHFPWLSLTR